MPPVPLRIPSELSVVVTEPELVHSETVTEALSCTSKLPAMPPVAPDPVTSPVLLL